MKSALQYHRHPGNILLQ